MSYQLSNIHEQVKDLDLPEGKEFDLVAIRTALLMKLEETRRPSTFIYSQAGRKKHDEIHSIRETIKLITLLIESGKTSLLDIKDKPKPTPTDYQPFIEEELFDFTDIAILSHIQAILESSKKHLLEAEFYGGPYLRQLEEYKLNKSISLIKRMIARLTQESQ